MAEHSATGPTPQTQSDGSKAATLGAAQRRGGEATTSERQFRLYEAGLGRRLARDWFVARYIWRITWLWLTVGGKLRKAKRAAAKEGRVLHIDRVMGGGDL